MLEQILNQLEDSENVDLRRRASFYQNVILTDLEVARKLVFGQKQEIAEEGLISLIAQNGLSFESINTLGAVHDKLPLSFQEERGEFEQGLE